MDKLDVTFSGNCRVPHAGVNSSSSSLFACNILHFDYLETHRKRTHTGRAVCGTAWPYLKFKSKELASCHQWTSSFRKYKTTQLKKACPIKLAISKIGPYGFRMIEVSLKDPFYYARLMLQYYIHLVCHNRYSNWERGQFVVLPKRQDMVPSFCYRRNRIRSPEQSRTYEMSYCQGSWHVVPPPDHYLANTSMQGVYLGCVSREDHEMKCP